MTVFGFNETDAKRIGRVVRLVERRGPDVELSGAQNNEVSRGVRLLLAKHESTNGWGKETTATVTVFNGDPIESAMTLVAHNQFLTFSTSTQCTQQWVALGHNGWGWYAIAKEPACTSTCSMDAGGFDFSALPNFDRTKIQLLGHSSACTATANCEPCLQWYDITTCSTAA